MPIYEFEGVRPELPAEGSYWIAPTAVLIGRVRLLPGANIWFGAVLRGDNEWIEVGADTNIQDMVMLHTDPGFPMVLGPGVTVGHKAILHGCTVGPGSLVGMGATLLNGARIGTESLVGANALVTEGKSFPDRSLIVGAPAKAVRTLDDAAVAGMQRTSRGYVERSAHFAATMRLVPTA